MSKLISNYKIENLFPYQLWVHETPSEAETTVLLSACSAAALCFRSFLREAAAPEVHPISHARLPVLGLRLSGPGRLDLDVIEIPKWALTALRVNEVASLVPLEMEDMAGTEVAADVR